MYKSLQAGRAVAAILVVLFHLGGNIAKEKYFGIAGFSIPFSFGDAGVEFFFVLSGFIIYSAHKNDLFTPGRFSNYARKRLIRIFPTYWIIFLLVYLMAFASPALRDTLPQDIGTLVKSLLLIPQDNAVVGGTGAPVIVVAWTLQYEIVFYLLFALLILNKTLSIFTLGGLLGVCVYLVCFGNTPLAFPATFFLSSYMLLFAMGMMVAVLCTHKSNSITPVNMITVGITLFLLISLDTVLTTKLLEEWQTLLYGIASSMIIYGLVKAEDIGRVMGGQKWVQLLGDSSYALYLIHFPLISILCKMAMLVHLDRLGFVGALIAFVVILITCLIVSVLFHLKVEKPITKYLGSLAKPSKSVA